MSPLAPMLQVLFFVALSISVTLGIWVKVYEMHSNDSISMRGLVSLGKSYAGMVDSLALVVPMILMSFAAFVVVRWGWKKFAHCFIVASFIFVTFFMSATLFRDVLLRSQVPVPTISAVSLALVYGVLGYLAFFTAILPELVHHFFVASNCSIIALFYLRSLPTDTLWFVLAAAAAWDIFSVCSEYGPLRYLGTSSYAFSNYVRHFSIGVSNVVQQQNGEDDNDDQEDEADQEILHLGMGDFVFFSMFAGKSATYGIPLVTVAAVVGVLVGLAFVLSRDSQEMVPALPVPLGFGAAAHFSALSLLRVFA